MPLKPVCHAECPERSATCHATCERYLEQTEERKKMMAEDRRRELIGRYQREKAAEQWTNKMKNRRK